MNTLDPVIVLKNQTGILSSLGLKNKRKEVFKIDKDLFVYNSLLGNIGEIPSDWIAFIKLGTFYNHECIMIGIVDEKKTYFKYKMSRFKQKMSEIFFKDTGAEIVIRQNEIGMPVSDFINLLNKCLNK